MYDLTIGPTAGDGLAIPVAENIRFNPAKTNVAPEKLAGRQPSDGRHSPVCHPACFYTPIRPRCANAFRLCEPMTYHAGRIPLFRGRKMSILCCLKTNQNARVVMLIRTSSLKSPSRFRSQLWRREEPAPHGNSFSLRDPK